MCLGQPGVSLLPQLCLCQADLFSFSSISCSSGHLQEGPGASSWRGGQEGLAGTQQRGVVEVLCPPVHPPCQGCDSPRAPSPAF